MLFINFLVISLLFAGAAMALGGWIPALLVFFGTMTLMFTLFNMVESTNKNIIRAVNILKGANK
jgi:hypothetical protein